MFILYFDNRYFKWAPVLIDSIKIFEPAERICIYGINLTEAQIEILKLYGVYYFEYDISILPVTSYRKYRKFTDDIRFFITHSQAYFLLSSFEKFPEESLFIIMDVDCLLIRPLRELKKEMDQHDLAGIILNEAMIAGGFKAVNPTDISRRMIKEWNDFLLDGHYYVNKDQFSFMGFYKKYRDDIRFLKLDHQYIDPQSNEDSYIWSAHKSKFGLKAERIKLYRRKLEEMKNELCVAQA